MPSRMRGRGGGRRRDWRVHYVPPDLVQCVKTKSTNSGSKVEHATRTMKRLLPVPPRLEAEVGEGCDRVSTIVTFVDRSRIDAVTASFRTWIRDAVTSIPLRTQGAPAPPILSLADSTAEALKGPSTTIEQPSIPQDPLNLEVVHNETLVVGRPPVCHRGRDGPQ